MKAIDVLQYLKSLAPDLKHEPLIDRVICGNPQIDVTGIAVCFMPYREIILKAHAANANVIVVHEPTFYAHMDLDDPEPIGHVATKEKAELINSLGITIIRCHDVWDCSTIENGVLNAWAEFLEVNQHIDSKVAHSDIYKINEQKALDFAQHVASKTATMKDPQTTLRFYGDPERKIKTVSIWGDPFIQAESGADLAVTYDDNPNMRAWIGSEWCRDTGYPVLVVNHGVLEEPGMATLAAELQKGFPQIPVTHIEQGCVYKEVHAASTTMKH